MSDTEKLQQRFDALITDFVAPLLAGGTVLLDQAIAPGAIGYFQHANSGDSAADADIFDRLHRGASSIAKVTTVPWPSRDLLLIAMAAHNLVLLTDPMLDRAFARGAMGQIATWIDQIVDAIGPPTTRADALARHALLDPLPALRRRDVVAKSWAYTYRFTGRKADDSVFSRPIFGRFRESETFTDVTTLLGEVDEHTSLGVFRRLRDLLSRSPVTELLRLELCQEFRFGLAALSVLSDDSIRGGIARAIVERGEWKAAPRLGRALADPMLHHAPPAHLYYALALAFEIQMTATLDVPGPNLPQGLDLTDPDTARYAAVLPAFFEDDTMLDEIRAFDDTDRADVQDRCARLASVLPPAVRLEVAPLVRRCQRPASRASLAALRETRGEVRS